LMHLAMLANRFGRLTNQPKNGLAEKAWRPDP